MLNVADQGGELTFFQYILIIGPDIFTSYKTSVQQIWKAGTGGVIALRSCDFHKTLSPPFSKGYNHQIWVVRLLRDTNKVQTNLKDTDDTIIVESHDFEKTL